MKTFDYCKNSTTLTEPQKAFANNRYYTVISALIDAAKTFSTPKNIYIGGSLALQEPALLFKDGKLKDVYSDLDIFVITQSIQDLQELQNLPFMIESCLLYTSDAADE